MNGFGKRIVAAREKKGYSQKKLAEILNITPTRLNYWEKDKREPDFFMFTKILNVLEADANEMLGLKKTSVFTDKYSKLNFIGKQKADEYIEDLTGNPKYTEHTTDTDAVFHTDNTNDNSAVFALQNTTVKNKT